MCLSAFGTYINILPLRERLKIIQFRQCLSSYCFYKARELLSSLPCSLYSEELCRKQEQRCALLPLDLPFGAQGSVSFLKAAIEAAGSLTMLLNSPANGCFPATI